MALKLHAQARTRLAELLIELLANTRVRSNSFLEFSSTAGYGALDTALPDSKSTLRRQLLQYVGDEPLSDFVIGQLTQSLAERPFRSDAATVSLPDLSDSLPAGDIAERLLSEFESLPWRYDAFIRLAPGLGSALLPLLPENRLEIGPGLSLVTAVSADEYPHGPEPALPFFLVAPVNLNPDAVYLRGSYEGYVTQYQTTAPLQRFLGAAKALVALGIAYRVLQPHAQYSASTPKEWVFVYRREADAWKREPPHEIGQDVATMLDSLGLVQAFRDASASQKLFRTRHLLEQFSVAFAEPAVNERLLLAAQWLFDSHSASNELLSFVLATVVLEILLGDKNTSEVTGLSVLLANRCAYLIGQSRKERDEVIRDFQKIYDTRSRIVHRGQNRLSSDERRDLYTLRWMCYRVIQEEVDLLKADQR